MLKVNQQYTDLPFFFTRNSFTGDMNTVNDLAAIRQAIKNILLTNNGERSFDYPFGGSLYSSIFENVNMELIMLIQSRISTNLRTYERRVELNDIRIIDNPKENAITVIVDYSIPDLGMNDVIAINLVRTR